MKLDQLTYFVETAKFESVARAAESLRISPSAISNSVAALEDELGYKLFIRQKKRIFLNQQGRVFKERAGQILESLDQLKRDVSSPELPFKGHYKIAVTRSLASDFIGQEWAKFQGKYDKLSVEFQTLRSVEIVARASQSEIDLGICFDPVPHPEVEQKRLWTDRYICVVRGGHSLLGLPEKNILQRLSEFPACMPRAFNGLGRYQSHSALEKLSVRPKVDFVYDSYDLAIPRILNSDAWALFPSFVLKRDNRNLCVLELDKLKAAISISAVWPRHKPLNAALLRFTKDLELRETKG